jgi:outer membrane protein OmpA-like peptidoglycan-associated protein/tetratricopeptide (TPR) repeat protein/type II secretory pathway pseudopilin PulG
VFTSQSQTREIVYSTQSKKAISAYKDAEKLYLEGNMEAALPKLKKAIEYDENFIEAWLLKGDVERDLGYNTEALKTYRKVIAIDDDFFPLIYYFAGNLSLDEGLYEESISFLESFLIFKNVRPEIQLQALDKLARAKFGNDAIQHPNGDSIIILNDSINSFADEYINSLRFDNREMLFTRRFQPDSTASDAFLKEKFFLSNKVNDFWQQAKELDIHWPEDDQIGALSISTDGNTMYFAACGLADGFGSCDIYQSNLANNVWGQPVNLGEKVNSTGWDSQPCISADGNQLYFVSKRKGGFGESDLWKCIRLSDGSWSDAINLGGFLNTSGNEMAPNLHADGKTLYFSSNGHIGLGKADLFLSRMDGAERWSKPINLGYPINSIGEELNIVFNSDGNQAFISCKRKDGFGGFDIYSVLPDNKNKPEAVSFVKVIVRDSVAKTYLLTEYEIVELESASEIVSGQTDLITGSFIQALPNGKQYALVIRKPGYCLHTEHFNLDNRTDNRPLLLEILLSPIRIGSTVVLNNVFFDVDKSEIKPESIPELKQVVDFLQLNPDLKIELGGHTDSDGDLQANLKLSAKRAEAVRIYLIEKGISEERVTAKGYGSILPVASNLTIEGKKLNRRTEFKIIENPNK